MPKMTIFSPAKLNLHLRVLPRRPDGFHGIESIFAALDFGDTLRFETIKPDENVEIRMSGQFDGEIPLEKNLVFKAVSLFRERTGFRQGLRIDVEKRIPPGGGLGGGSSNAAAALFALNELAAQENRGIPLEAESLAVLGASLGSDVPFFLKCGGFGGAEPSAAWVTGRGEKIMPLKTPSSLFFTLVNPGFTSDTAAAYRFLDQFREESAGESTKNVVNGKNEHFDGDINRIFDGDPREWPFFNDFLPVFLNVSAQNSGKNDTTHDASNSAAYRDILAGLREQGAAFAGLSGSGSTCFGVFESRLYAEKAAAALGKVWSFAVVSATS